MKHCNYKGVILIVTLMLLCLSIGLNLYQYSQHTVSIVLKGTYMATSDSLEQDEYLVFNASENFCKYTQNSNVLEGTYIRAEENYFKLISENGTNSCILLVPEGIYLFSENNKLAFYTKIADEMVFLGTPETEFPDWRNGD